MKKDVSIILPSIRPQFLETFYASAQNACKKHSFEIVIPTPFDVPEEIKRRENVKIIKTHSTPTVAKQMAIQLCNAEFLYNCTDDGFLLDDVIDEAVEWHRKEMSRKDVINMIYVEGVLDPNTLEPRTSQITPLPSSYWHPWSQKILQIPGIEKEWRVCLHFFMKLEYYYELGGMDCIYEYSNFAIHDLMYRVQEDGGKILDLPKIAYVCSHFPNRTGDHGPVNDAQEGPDTKIFLDVYNQPKAAAARIKIPYDNWKNCSDVWTRRFSKTILPITREEYEKSI